MSGRGRPFVVMAIVGVMLLVACSVRTPRDGFTAARRGELANQAGTAGEQAGVQGGTATASGQASTNGGVNGAGGATSGAGGTSAGGSSGVGGPTGGSAGATSSGSTVGVTKDTITISAMAGFSGNYGAILTTIYDRGFGTWVDDVNAHGGIYGRKVVAKKVDNQDTVEGGVSACKTIQNNGSYLAVSIVGFGGADVSSADCLDRAGIPDLGLNLSGWSNRWARVYSAGDAGKQAKPMASYIRDVIGDNGRIGIIHTNDPVNNASRAGLADELHRLGMNLVHEETVSVNQASYVAPMTNMKNARVTTVALIENTNEVIGTIRDAKSIGYNPHYSGNFWVTDESSSGERALYDGIKALRNYSSTNSPGYADYVAKAKKYGHGDVITTGTAALYGIGLLAGQVLQNAGPNPTTAGLPGAIESIVNYNNGLTMTLSFGKGVKVPEVGMWPIQCCNSDNTWRGIGDPKTFF